MSVLPPRCPEPREIEEPLSRALSALCGGEAPRLVLEKALPYDRRLDPGTGEWVYAISPAWLDGRDGAVHIALPYVAIASIEATLAALAEECLHWEHGHTGPESMAGYLLLGRDIEPEEVAEKVSQAPADAFTYVDVARTLARRLMECEGLPLLHPETCGVYKCWRSLGSWIEELASRGYAELKQLMV